MKFGSTGWSRIRSSLVSSAVSQFQPPCTNQMSQEYALKSPERGRKRGSSECDDPGIVFAFRLGGKLDMGAAGSWDMSLRNI